MLFLYDAIDKNGNIVRKGSISAPTKEVAKQNLKAGGYKLLKIKSQGILNRDIRLKKGLTRTELAFFCRSLYFFVDAGISFSEFGLVAGAGKANKQLHTLKQSVLNGEKLHIALRQAGFPIYMCSMVKIGEESGKLTTILAKLETHYEKEHETQRDITSMLIYPAIVLLVMVAVVAITVLYLVPSFEQMFAMHNIALPFATVVLVAMSDFFANYFLWVLACIVALLTVLTRKKVFDTLLFKLPVSRKIAKIVCTNRFATSMAIMMDAGVPIVFAVEITADLFNNRYYKKIIAQIKDELQKGVSLSSALTKASFFDQLLISMVQLGESTGTITASLEKCSTYFEKEQTLTINRLKKQAEPMLTIIIGAVLAFIMLAIMLPTLELTGVL